MFESCKVRIIDYGVGNTASVSNALSLLGVKAVITKDKKEIEKSTHLILPGVGSFGEGMTNLKKNGLDNLIKNQVLSKGKKILGICLGMQLLASKGFEYGEHDGLEIIPGKVIKIDNSISKLHLPHIGWNNVNLIGNHKITRGFEKEPIFYFVHSFHFVPENNECVAGVCDYGEKIVSILEHQNIFGVQFHPEKSHDDGFHILRNFLSI